MSPDDTALLFRHPSRRLPRAELHSFLEEVARRVAKGRRVTCLITDDTEMRRLNREFRGKNYATDVLSFPTPIDEIAISLDRAVEQAAEHGHSVGDELRILILHGVLHLTGLDHETDSGEMAASEGRWRKRFGLPVGLIERARA